MGYELAGILLTVVVQALYLAYRIGKFEEKLVVIEKKQDKHNEVIERTFSLERDVSVLKEQIRNENHRIEDLEDVVR